MGLNVDIWLLEWIRCRADMGLDVDVDGSRK